MSDFEYDDMFTDEELRRAFRAIYGLRDGGMSYVRDREVSIRNLMPHYTDMRFQRARTVYLDAAYKLNNEEYPTVPKGVKVGYDYSDRLWQWNWTKANTTRKQANEQHAAHDTAACLETWLRLYFDKPNLKLIHVLAGFNVSNGYPYQVFGYLAEGVTTP